MPTAVGFALIGAWRGARWLSAGEEPAFEPAPTELRKAVTRLINRFAAAIISFSKRVATDPRLYTSFLQVGDGVSVSVKHT